MTKHITLRLAWHTDGWNGHVCKNPNLNTYCIGNYSYPGDKIKLGRELDWELLPEVAGKACSKLDQFPACALSVNAFGNQHLKALNEPPNWFNDNSEGILIDISPSTACVWPYEVMYGDDVKAPYGSKQTYDYEKRLDNAKNYFSELEKDKSLVFYYVNYSNPFSEEDSRKYVLVGVSRLKKIGQFEYYKNVSEENKKKYAGGFVWQMPVTSHYPDQGFKIPYEKYLDSPEELKKLLFVPENSRNFKYATRHVDNDDALSMVEIFLEKINFLIEIGDKSENWKVRRDWLLNLMEELWHDRGAYPGVVSSFSTLGFNAGIEYYKKKAESREEKEAFEELKKVITGEIKSLDGLIMLDKEIKNLQRNWKLKDKYEKEFLLDVVPRINLSKKQLENILSEQRNKNGIYNTLKKIISNPFILSENYKGDNIDDFISFNKIEHGMLPSPELGIEAIFEKNAPQRFRALCVNQLKYATVHTFVSANDILIRINTWLDSQPDWKKETFTSQYFEVDKDFIEEVIQIRMKDDKIYLYLKDVYDDERQIQKTLENFVLRPDLQPKKPVTLKKFSALLTKTGTELFKNAEAEYLTAIKNQSEVCLSIFNKPLSVISGAAGTGKTTIIESIIKMIEAIEGTNSSIFLMAPTGKAAERIKEKTGRKATTIHSFLASHGWLNDNLTFNRVFGVVEDNISTLVIDECSMIDNELFAALFRAINWNSIKRLILVGDPNQLPPIGRGRVFSEIIDWIKNNYHENLGKLNVNVRQLENRVSDKGNGILDLAEIYIQENQDSREIDEVKKDSMIEKLQVGGRVDKDLNVIYWEDDSDLEEKIKEIIIKDMENDTNVAFDEDRPYELINAAFNSDGKKYNTTYQQIISPFRGEFYGVEKLNIVFQNLYNEYWSKKITNEGIALFDKVIQIRNRPKSNQISAYNSETRKAEYIEIYNGEIGVVKMHPFDKRNWKTPYYRMERFQVVFNRKEKYWVGFGKNLGKDENDRWIKEENPLDNLELGYVISVHKAQGSDFERVYLVLPNRQSLTMSMELLYTAITRAKKHLTIFAQNDVTTFLSLLRKESSSLRKINSSLFTFNPLPEEILTFSSWYEEGKVISTLSKFLVRSKSEMNIANILTLKNIPFKYEMPLYAPDGTMYLPDFTVSYKGKTYYWEHIGRLDLPKYKEHWEKKESWYNKHFSGQLIVTYESEKQTTDIEKILENKFNN